MRTVSWLIAIVLMAACSGDDSKTDTGAVSDGDADTDGDSDSDSDGDSDSDSDSDADTDTDSDADSDADADTDADSDTDADADSDTDTDSDADTDTGPDTGNDTGVIAVCSGTDLGSTVPQLVTGSTVGEVQDYSLSCGASTSGDVAYTFTAPNDGTYSFDLTANTDYDSILALIDCSLGELDCADGGGYGGETLYADLAAGETVGIVVGGYLALEGNYELAIDVVPDEICDDEIDNDFDFDVDCYDANCQGDPVCAVTCVTDTSSLTAVPQTFTGSTAAQADTTFSITCGYTEAPDYAFEFTAPAAGTYTFDTYGSTFDTVLYAREGDCNGIEIACADDSNSTAQSEISVTLTAGQVITVIVDGYGTNSGDFTLNVN